MENKAENDRLKSPEEREAVQADDDGLESEFVAAEAHAESELEVLREEGELEELP
jgi:hypothetical protein